MLYPRYSGVTPLCIGETATFAVAAIPRDGNTTTAPAAAERIIPARTLTLRRRLPCDLAVITLSTSRHAPRTRRHLRTRDPGGELYPTNARPAELSTPHRAAAPQAPRLA